MFHMIQTNPVNVLLLNQNCLTLNLKTPKPFKPSQNQKLSASGQEIGGDLVFGKRMGFSGTPSDLIPVEFGKCCFEEGDDGKIITTLTSPAIVR